MVDHITLRDSDIEQSRRFYSVALAPLGYVLSEESVGEHGQKIAGFCAANKRDFWLTETKEGTGQPPFSCLAFGAAEKNAVDAFYASALELGGRNNGPPGYRPQYHPGYYAAFVLDPNGYNIEAVFDDWAHAERMRE